MEKPVHMPAQGTEIESDAHASELLGPFQEIVGAIRDEVLVHAALRSLNAKMDEISVSAHRLIADAASTLVETKSRFGAGTVSQKSISRLDLMRSAAEDVEELLKEVMDHPEGVDAEGQPPEEVLAAMRGTAECARRLISEVDHGKELLRRLSDREADVAQSRGLRAYVAYQKAVGEVFPGAQLGKLTLIGAEGQYSIVVPIKLPSFLDGRTRARREQELHEKVESQDPSLTGLLAFQYVVA